MLALLVDGAVAVTPNRRLARAILQAFDAERRASGLTVWPTPTILPYPTWLAWSWERLVSAGAASDGALLITAAQSTVLWEQIVAADARVLLNPRGAASLAAEAWSLAHAWGSGSESWRAWRRDDRDADDPSMFAAWAERYAADLRRIGARDLAQLPDVLVTFAPKVASMNRTIVLVGFIELTPQQQRLFTALGNESVALHRVEAPAVANAGVRRTVAVSPRAELVAALTWARESVIDAPGKRVGIVVEDLATRREEVVALAEDILCPSAILPGQASAARPFEISLGRSLATVPLIAAALDLIGLAESRLSAGAVSALLRSAYLPGADPGWTARAAIERDWLEDGRSEVTLADAIAALDGRAPALAPQWRDAAAVLAHDRGATPRGWADRWREWLAAAGWPGPRTLDSAEYQSREAWEGLLLEFSSLTAVTKRMSRSTALGKLRAMAAERVFQPEGGDAPVQIMGILEASGMSFDALWVAGLAADRWPPPPQANPMLPIAWQRDRGIPNASPAGDLAFFRTLTVGFAGAATEVIFSSASTIDDRPSSPSSLIMSHEARMLPTPTSTWSQRIALSRDLESINDDRAPRISPGSVAPGGSRIIDAQSDCPFQAVARHRLDARAWPEPLASLSPQERGQLVHLSMAAFWSAIRDHATLSSLDGATRQRAVEIAVKSGLGQFPPVRWRSLPAVVRNAEAKRLERLVLAWLEIERARPPFAVEGVERNTSVELASLKFRVRSDRVDALGDGGTAIIDFKTGRADKPGRWFDARPQATQLGMYVLAQRDAHADISVRAAVYAELRPDAVVAVGVAADSAAWPGVTDVRKTMHGDWPAMEAWWRAELGSLASEIVMGEAAVRPRQRPLACNTCRLHALCRIQSVRNLAEEHHDDD
jgi:ATP-dependent helicase/nuclease subunit B